MNRRSFLRFLGLGVPGLALFGWSRRRPGTRCLGPATWRDSGDNLRWAGNRLGKTNASMAELEYAIRAASPPVAEPLTTEQIRAFQELMARVADPAVIDHLDFDAVAREVLL